MAQLHPDLTHATARARLDAAVADLEAQLPAANDDQLLTGLMQVVAMVSAGGCDAHTGLFVWGTGSYPVHSLPLRLWWFADGIRIVDALPPYGDLVGDRIDEIAGSAIGAVLAVVTPLIPRDNDLTIRLLMPRFLLIPEVLHGLGLVDEVGGVALDVVAPDGATREVTVDSLPMADYNAWAGAYGLHLPANPAVPYLSRIDDALWWTSLDAGRTLFVQENRVDRTPGSQLDALRAALAVSTASRIVLDLRNNYGGEVDGVDPFVALFQEPDVAQPGRLFIVTGRNTFSAASLMVARLVDGTAARVVGEPMGGCPTAYGDADELRLPYGGIVVDVARRLEVGVAADDPRQTIEPDLGAPLSFDDWRAGLDPALAAIRAAVP